MEAVILEKLVRKGVSEDKIFKKKPERIKEANHENIISATTVKARRTPL